jgi:protein ImuB
VEVTGLEVEFFRSLGVTTVGELLRLPREGLAQRCGAHVAGDLDRALGALPEPRVFFAPPPCFAAGLELPAPVIHAEGLLFGARRLLVQLEGLLTALQAGIRGFALKLTHADAPESIVQVGLASPARDTERLAQVLRERLGSVILPAPVEAMRLEAGDFAPLPGRSGAMFGDAAGDAEDWARLAERLRARLGHDAVYGLTTHPDHRPEHAWRRVEPGEWDPHEFKAPGPRPAWLLAPRKLNEGEFAPLAGPERIESGWWDGDEAKRDYFVARLPNASLAWVYREADEWYLHGLFA